MTNVFESMLTDITAVKKSDNIDKWFWATVTESDPIRIMLDTDTEPIAADVTSLVGSMSVGSRVWCQMFNGYITIHGPSGGGGRVVGSILPFAGSVAPDGYLFARGQSVSTTEYANLFAVIGYAYGGSGANFSLPNLQGRVPVGLNSSETNFNTLGKTGGSATYTLTVNEMPSHTHTQNSHSHTSPEHTHGNTSHSHNTTTDTNARALSTSTSGAVQGYVSSSTGGGYYRNTPLSSNSTGGRNINIHSTSVTIESTTATNQYTGGGQAFSLLQPYTVVNYIIAVS